MPTGLTSRRGWSRGFAHRISVEHEIGNLEKCLAAGFEHVVLIAAETRILAKARQAAAAVIDDENLERVRFFTPDELFAFLEALEVESAGSEQVIRGRKVRTTHKAVGEEEKKACLKVIADTIARNAMRMKGRDMNQDEKAKDKKENEKDGNEDKD